jgi:hypothetical protein
MRYVEVNGMSTLMTHHHRYKQQAKAHGPLYQKSLLLLSAELGSPKGVLFLTTASAERH